MQWWSYLRTFWKKWLYNFHVKATIIDLGLECFTQNDEIDNPSGVGLPLSDNIPVLFPLLAFVIDSYLAKPVEVIDFFFGQLMLFKTVFSVHVDAYRSGWGLYFEEFSHKCGLDLFLLDFIRNFRELLSHAVDIFHVEKDIVNHLLLSPEVCYFEGLINRLEQILWNKVSVFRYLVLAEIVVLQLLSYSFVK